ncbi:MAG: glycine cleavage system protein H [Candidatus Lindowbacteria bacterium]|nr:glycine cleavage system protein H [Candidatus Lindowbacteria bacterium]
MIPVAMPVIIIILTFLLLMGLSLITVACFDQIARFVRVRAFKGTMDEEAAAENIHVASASVIGPQGTMIARAIRAAARVEGYALPESLYYHQGHAWVAPREADTAFVGIDEFAAKLIGKPSSIDLPRVGDRCRQGGKGWTLSRNARKLEMLFPLDGEVIAVNERAMANPEFLSREPYGGGWLVLVRSKNLKQNLRNLLRANVARRWMEESAAEIRSAFSGKLGLVFQDGGLPEEGIADCFDAADWRKFVSRVFMHEPE